MSHSVAVVAGAMAAKPGSGGEAWVRLSWLLGLRRLGFRVAFVEELHAPPSADGPAWFEQVTAAFGIAERWLVRDGEVLAGGSAEELADVVGETSLLLNISGNLRDPVYRDRPACRVFVDVDPGYTQLWHAAGEDVGLDGHDHFFTVGLRVGRSGCALPTRGVAWRATLPPVVLAEWPASGVPPGRFTTVASWRGGYGRVRVNGTVYGQKAHEFRRLAHLPSRVPYRLEVALRFDDGDEADRGLLEGGGWEIVDPAAVAGTPAAFRSYVSGSSAELSPAQGIYVDTSCGWVSDRTAHYLAAGRPALVQDTGIGEALPLGVGLLTFRTPAEAAKRARDVVESHSSHAAAARRLAEERFDSDRVIGSVLEAIGVGP